MSPLKRVLFALSILIILTTGWWMWNWTSTHPTISASGGLWFPTTVLNDVPSFAQADPLWADQQLAATPATLAAEGCAVTSAAMVLASYGAHLDPASLNKFLQNNEGYTPEGWLYWEKASEFPPVLAEHIYEDNASHFLIDWNLLCGNPVIVRLRYPNGITHFVVIVGKTGFDYLIRDPGHRNADGIYKLSEFGSPIEALRFYRKNS